jgi:hypothetical protein
LLLLFYPPPQPPPPPSSFLFFFFFFFFPLLLLWPPIFETLFVWFVRTETTVEKVTANFAKPSTESSHKSQSGSRLSTGRLLLLLRLLRHSGARAGRF